MTRRNSHRPDAPIQHVVRDSSRRLGGIAWAWRPPGTLQIVNNRLPTSRPRFAQRFQEPLNRRNDFELSQEITP